MAGYKQVGYSAIPVSSVSRVEEGSLDGGSGAGRTEREVGTKFLGLT